MQFSQRTPRSEIHFYIQKLVKKGYRKIATRYYLGGYKVVLERTTKKHTDILTVKFSNNGWCSVMNGNQIIED